MPGFGTHCYQRDSGADTFCSSLTSVCGATAGQLLVWRGAAPRIGSRPLLVLSGSLRALVDRQQLTPSEGRAREALGKQAQAERSAADAKKRAAEALAGRADAQRALDNVAKCAGLRVQGLGPMHSERSTTLPSCVCVMICSVHQRSPELG